MMEMCSDNRFELIAKYKQKLIEATNIETSPEEMAVIDTVLFRCWQMGWLDSLEKQNTQKPNKAIDKSWGTEKEVCVCPRCDYYLPHYEWIIATGQNKATARRIVYCEVCGQAVDMGEN